MVRHPEAMLFVNAATLLLLGQLLLVIAEETAARTRQPRYRFNIHKDDIFYDTRVIPLDHQVSAFLYKGETKMFFYLHERDGTPLSITVTPCTSSIAWSVRYRDQNNTGKLNDMTVTTNTSGPPLQEFRGSDMKIFSLDRARLGLYVLQVSPLERETYVYLYANREPGGPHPLRLSQQPKLRVQKRLRRKRLTVRWEPSSVDPHLMHYCLVVNTRRHYSTLCEAEGERYGVSPPEVSHLMGFNFPREQAEAHKSELASKAARLNASRLGRGSGAGGGELHEDIVVECVGRKTHYTLVDLEHGKVYHFNLFAVNKRTNLSFPYGKTSLKYEPRNKPAGLKDGKLTSVNLKDLDGRATFKFKVGQNAGEQLQFYVMPCGGAVDAEVLLKNKAVASLRRVDGYGKVTVNATIKGERYLLRLTSPNAEELRRISGVEIVANTRPASRFPLPDLPSELRVHEYESLRRCDSVTVGWIPSPDPRPLRYCVFAREDKKRDLEVKRPNQCGLDSRLKKHADFTIMHCQDRPPAVNNDTKREPLLRPVTTQKISNLKQGRHYIVQVTVTKSRGKTLSYDFLHVHTKNTCT